MTRFRYLNALIHLNTTESGIRRNCMAPDVMKYQVYSTHQQLNTVAKNVEGDSKQTFGAKKLLCTEKAEDRGTNMMPQRSKTKSIVWNLAYRSKLFLQQIKDIKN